MIIIITKIWVAIQDCVPWLFSGIGLSLISSLYNKRKKNCFPEDSPIKELPKEDSIKYFDKSIYIGEKPPDGTIIKIGEKLHKEWTIKNAGQTVWKGRYLKSENSPVHVQQSVTKVIMPKISPGQQYTLKVDYVVNYEGEYRLYWKMYDKNNNQVYPELEGLGVTITVKR